MAEPICTKHSEVVEGKGKIELAKNIFLVRKQQEFCLCLSYPIKDIALVLCYSPLEVCHNLCDTST